MNYLPATSQGRVLIVESISVSHTKLSKKSPLIVTLITRDPDIPDLASKNMITDLEHALLLGEIISPNEPMSREAAIKKLKESKELLDLELISQQEYDKIKDELTPIIRN